MRLDFHYYSDCHFLGVAEKKGIKINYARKRTKCIGDNHEGKNIPKYLISVAKALYKKHIKECDISGCIEINGNHECSMADGVDFDIDRGVLSTHGHIIYYSAKKVLKWATRKLGAGKLSLWISSMIHKCRDLRPMKEFSKKQEKKLSKYITKMRLQGHDFHTLVHGHTHCDVVIRKMINGVMCINVPQGYTKLELIIPQGY